MLAQRRPSLMNKDVIIPERDAAPHKNDTHPEFESL